MFHTFAVFTTLLFILGSTNAMVPAKGTVVRVRPFDTYGDVISTPAMGEHTLHPAVVGDPIGNEGHVAVHIVTHAPLQEFKPYLPLPPSHNANGFPNVKGNLRLRPATVHSRYLAPSSYTPFDMQRITEAQRNSNAKLKASTSHHNAAKEHAEEYNRLSGIAGQHYNKPGFEATHKYASHNAQLHKDAVIEHTNTYTRLNDLKDTPSDSPLDTKNAITSGAHATAVVARLVAAKNNRAAAQQNPQRSAYHDQEAERQRIASFSHKPSVLDKPNATTSFNDAQNSNKIATTQPPATYRY